MVNELIQFRRMVRNAGDGKTLVPNITSASDKEGGLVEKVRFGNDEGEGKSIVVYQYVKSSGQPVPNKPIQWKIEGVSKEELPPSEEKFTLVAAVGEIFSGYGVQLEPKVSKDGVIFTFAQSQKNFTLLTDSNLLLSGTFILLSK